MYGQTEFGGRISQYKLDEKIEQVSGVIIPKKTINELSKLLSDISKSIPLDKILFIKLVICDFLTTKLIVLKELCYQ